MKNRHTSKVAILFFLFSSIILLNSKVVKAQDKNKEDEISNLKDKIEMLEKKLQKQEDEIAGLKKEVDDLKNKKPLLALPEIRDHNNLRKGKRFEFNGQTYYMVPLNGDSLKKIMK